MKFEVVYEVPPMRGFFRTELSALSVQDAKDKILSNPDTANYRIKEIYILVDVDYPLVEVNINNQVK